MLHRTSSRLKINPEETGIPLSPLIDCVFLLLIFFLVTTMLKRKETMVVVAMPDAASSLSSTAHEEVLIVGLDEAGGLLIPDGRDPYGALTYRPGDDLAAHLGELLAADPGTAEKPLRLDVAQSTPFQKTIDAIDTCKQQGFHRVSVKLRQPFGD